MLPPISGWYACGLAARCQSKANRETRAKGLTFREIGERFGVTPKAVSQSYRHARKRLELDKLPVIAETDVSLLRAALIGYEIQIAQLRAKVAAITEMLRAAGYASAVSGVPTISKRGRLSAAARKKISVAQKKRWAARKR